MVLFGALLGAVGRQVPLPVVGQVIEGSAAFHAGLREGDQIRAINGMPVKLFEDLRQVVVASPNRDVSLLVHRGTTDMTVTAHILAAPVTGAGLLGVKSGAVETVRLGPLQAVVGGVAQTWDMLRQTLLG
ncbi:MAG: PDZ domain-containing protein [Rhodospirillales bacterium]